jgi:hypothetical protein
MGTGGPFLGGKARSWRDADHSLPSSAEVKKLYLLLAPACHSRTPFYFILITRIFKREQKFSMPVSGKVVSALQKVSELINQFPTSNVEDVDIIAACDNVRARFKKACALLKVDGTFPELSKL